MARRNYREIFIDELRKMSGGGEKLVGNISLREKLGWDVDRYSSIKRQLFDEDVIVVARGKGGSVGLADSEGVSAAKVFVSYSHKDAQLEQELVMHLEPLKRLGLIDVWHDVELKAGDEWNKDIAKNLENSDIVLLLISIDFINSPYCYDNELQKAMERHSSGESRVIPIILRSCSWKYSPFSKLLALPANGRAITSFADRDGAFAEVAEAIHEIVVRMREDEE